MWEAIKGVPRGRLSTRKYLGFVPALLVACFLYIFLATPAVHAADAEFNSDSLTYNSQQYSGPFTATNSKPGGGISSGSKYYTSISSSNGSEGSIISFPADSDPTKATSAKVQSGDYDKQTGTFGNLSPPKTISVGPASAANAGKTSSECNVDGVGWIVCSMSSWIADGVDYLYGILSNFFVFEPLTTTTPTNSLYKLWTYVRNLANVVFIVAFLIVIYSQMTSGMMSNYTVKKMLPRIIIAAVLVNTSYWICAVAIDISNILGIAIQDLFTQLRDGLGAAKSANIPDWSTVTKGILSGAGIVVGGGALLAATGGTVGGIVFLLLAAILPAIFAALVAVAILAARQALITVLVVLAPLAFVAYILPNTEDMFTRWRKLLTNLLVMFPMFSVIFGGSQLAGVIIIQNSRDISVALLGLTVQVVPLFITPFLIRLSSGLLGTIAGLTNDRSKGIFDRGKNWANANREQHRQRGFSTQRRTGFGRIRPTNMARGLNNRTLRREGMTAAHKSVAQARFSETRGGRQVHEREANAKLYQGGAEAANQEAWTQGVRNSSYRRGVFEDTHMATGRSKLHESVMTNNAEERLQQQVESNHDNLRTAKRLAHTSEGRAKVIEEALNAQNENTLQGQVAGSAHLRGLKIDTAEFQGRADITKANIEAEGQAALKNVVLNDRDLRKTVVQTNEFSKRAELAESVVQARADAHWNNVSNSNPTLRGQKLEQHSTAQSAKYAEEQWNTIISNIEAVGSAAPGVSPAEGRVANTIQKVTERLSVEALRKSNADSAKQEHLTKTLLEDTTIINGQTIREYAGGIRGDQGAESVLASAVANKRKEYIDKVGEKTQLAKHFNLSSDERQSLAVGGANVTKTVDGATYEFKTGDDFVRESMIDEQLKTGAFSQIEEIVKESGVGGKTHKYATSISDAIVSNGLTNKALYFGAKTIDDVAQGRILGDSGLYNAALYHMQQGKIKDDVLAAQSPDALRRMFTLGANPALAPEFAALSPAEQQGFIENAAELRQAADRILRDPILRSRADKAARDILEQYRA